jgi:hypothetical protein
MEGTEAVGIVRRNVAAAWRGVLRPGTSDSMADDPRYLVGVYHGARDLYCALGGRWADLRPLLDEVEAECGLHRAFGVGAPAPIIEAVPAS